MPELHRMPEMQKMTDERYQRTPDERPMPALKMSAADKKKTRGTMTETIK